MQGAMESGRRSIVALLLFWAEGPGPSASRKCLNSMPESRLGLDSRENQKKQDRSGKASLLTQQSGKAAIST
jgi:hypothetical protein